MDFREFEKRKTPESAHPLQKEFGFLEPEDGSKRRYIHNRAEHPWGDHTFWWVMHNVVAHPLIGLAPLRVTFRFHDWTSRKMHGK